MKTILLTANSSWYLANFRSGLIQALRAEGHSITVLAPPDDHVARLQALGCHTIPLQMDNKGTAPHRDARLLLTFRKHLRQLRPAAILSFTVKNNVYCGLAARSLGIPFLPTVSGLGTAFVAENWLTRVVTTLSRSAFKAQPRVVFQNPDDIDLFVARGIIVRRAAMLVPGSGVDLAHCRPAPLPNAAETSFLLIARMLWDKGVGEFVEAIRQMRAAGLPVRGHLLGFLGVENKSAISHETMQAWVQEGVIEYHGPTEDVRPFIAAADCVVLPTAYREGTPRSLLEAGAMARPLITTDTPGCRDVVEHGKTGFLCQPKDVESLRVAMQNFLQLAPTERQDMGLASRARIERDYDETIVIRAYLHALSEMTHPPRA